MTDTRRPSASTEAFAALGISDHLCAALKQLGYEEPTPVQRETIPLFLTGRDLTVLAATGTGKTAAFALPMLQRLAAKRPARRTTRGVVLVPTRELAMQVAEAVHKYGRGAGVVVPVYGGASIGQQIRALERGADVVVATPGRALDLLRRGALNLSAVEMLVLDEADEMLDMGFAEDLEEILDAVPDERQTALFSATMSKRIEAIAERHLKDPHRVAIARETAAIGKVPRVRQLAYVVGRAHKALALQRVLDMESPESVIVFCRTRIEVDDLVEKITAHGYRAAALHGGMAQRQRDSVMKRFRSGQADLLIATDVATRGLDIEQISHVVNYDLPSSAEAYVHRIGRTGRAGRPGTAITLIDAREHRLLKNIERVVRQKIEVCSIPTVADLRARRLDLTRASIRERLLQGGLDDVRPVIESLAAEFDVVDVAAAAVHLAHAAIGRDGDDVAEIPAPHVNRGESAGRDRSSARERPTLRPRRHDTDERAEPFERPKRGRPDRAERPDRQDRAGRAERSGGSGGRMVRLFVGAGRDAGIRPADLVGAIANEAGISARDLGGIEIGSRFSLVEVPEDLADSVVTAMRRSTLRGKKVQIRRDRES
ncbi:MAG: DEAD/DEAH box helicase [Acidobacteriaceae bacterium]|jgi:ATP-dependent RNA helicase DeaD|nr:DEAD/DEAH box helicase [Acidobacteriaceae bacterium]